MESLRPIGSQRFCTECGSPLTIKEDFGYCPFCDAPNGSVLEQTLYGSPPIQHDIEYASFLTRLASSLTDFALLVLAFVFFRVLAEVSSPLLYRQDGRRHQSDRFRRRLPWCWTGHRKRNFRIGDVPTDYPSSRSLYLDRFGPEEARTT